MSNKFRFTFTHVYIHAHLDLNLNQRRKNPHFFLLIETDFWKDNMSFRLNMLKSKHILQEKRAECAVHVHNVSQMFPRFL